MSAAGCGLSACTLNRRLPWLHVGWSALAPMAKVRFETPSQRTSAVVVREPGPKCECNFSHCAHSRCHVDRTPWDPYKYSTQLTTTLAQALVKLSSPLDNRPSCVRVHFCYQIGSLRSGRWHLSLASAHRGLARCAVGVEPRLSGVWTVVVNTFIKPISLYRPSCVRVHLLSDRISARISLVRCVRATAS